MPRCVGGSEIHLDIDVIQKAEQQLVGVPKINQSFGKKE